MGHPLTTTIKKIKELDENLLIRKNILGEAAFLDLEPIWKEVLAKTKYIERYYSRIGTNTNDRTYQALEGIYQTLSGLQSFDKSQFVSQQTTILKNVNGHLSDLREYWPSYAIAAIQDSGLLENINVNDKLDSLITELNERTNEALAKIDNQSTIIIDEARKKANEIESTVRKSATGVSVIEAQNQFKDAARHNVKQIKIWGGISIGFIILFVACIYYFLVCIDIPNEWNWSFTYSSIIRIVILALLSTIIAFCLKMLKANLHMHQHNLHRKRIANSMASFVESAMDDRQRDIILSQLIESVSQFGSSGILGKDSDKGGISIDSITKTVSSLNENV